MHAALGAAIASSGGAGRRRLRGAVHGTLALVATFRGV